MRLALGFIVLLGGLVLAFVQRGATDAGDYRMLLQGAAAVLVVVGVGLVAMGSVQ